MKRNWYIFRHSLATLSKTGYGDQILTASILPEYTEPIKKMAQFLKDISPSANFSSEILRCRQTTAIISDITNKQFTTDQRLNEFNEETFNDLKNRVKNFLESLEKDRSENILICTHGAIAAGLKHFILENAFLEEDINDYPSCGQLLIIKNNQPEYLDFNI